MHPLKALPSSLALLAVLGAGCERRDGQGDDPGAQAVSAARGTPASKPARKVKKYEYDSVPANHDVTVPEGFRGDVHPLLHGETRLELTARWTPTLKEQFRSHIRLGKVDSKVGNVETASLPEYSLPDELVRLLTESKPAHEHAIYGPKDLSIFFPAELTETGQMWKIDPEAAAVFLRQFHEHTATTFDRYHQPYGRRPGPAGAFGIVRALSPSHAEILFRVHAEFDLLDGSVVYTPACFLGRMLVDREAGTVAALEMHVPTDRPVNVNILLTFPHPELPKNEVTNIVFEHVEPMELSGGDLQRLEAVTWDDELDLESAHERLKSAFYKFLDIGWVPTEQAVALAQEAHKPILAVVLTSPLDDQSC